MRASTITPPLSAYEPCPACAGEGYQIHVGAPGRYDLRQEAWFPSETLEPCPACHGTGIDLTDEAHEPSGATAPTKGTDHDHQP